MRLDDACEKRDIDKWNRIENLLDVYNIKPLVGVIPHCEDCTMEKYTVDSDFWARVSNWEKKGWTIAMHGYNHVYTTQDGGINPVNRRSEFAGEVLSVQKEKIRKALSTFRKNGIEPQVFFAPSHTFDRNTICALKECSNISFISDTIATRPYSQYGMTFVPQQSGRVRKLPFHTVTFCYHPNNMTDSDFTRLEVFLKDNCNCFVNFPLVHEKRKRSLLDKILEYMYMRQHNK